MFPVSQVYFFVGGAKAYNQTEWGPWPDPSGSANDKEKL